MLLLCPIVSGLLYVALSLLFSFIDNRAPRCKQVPKRWCLAASVFVFLCWIPVLLASFPGFFNYDAGVIYLGQWAQVESGVLNDHHPVLHTLFLELSINFGQTLFGSFNAGVCVSVIIQAFCVVFLIGFTLNQLIDWGIGKVGFVLTTAYYAFDPIISMFAFCTTKDVFCSVFIVTLCLIVYRVCRDEKKPSRKQQVAIIALTFLISSLRANALIAIILFTIISCVLLDCTLRKTIARCLITGIIVSLVWLVPISNALGVQPSPFGSWNMLGVPMQQLSLCSIDDRVVEEDRENLLEQIPGITYREGNSDITRNAFMNSSSSGGVMGFFRTYLKTYLSYGLKYPGIYLDAFLLHTQAAWSPFAIIGKGSPNKDIVNTEVFECVVKEPATLDSKITGMYDILHWISSERGVESIPLAGLIVSIAFYMQVLALCASRLIAAKNRCGLALIAPLVFMALTNLFGPCMLIRYFLYLFFAFPILIFLVVHNSVVAFDRQRSDQ